MGIPTDVGPFKLNPVFCSDDTYTPISGVYQIDDWASNAPKWCLYCIFLMFMCIISTAADLPYLRNPNH